ncbi:MAG TPA: DUF6194 family protein [Ktedonobacteraceae bacterium]|nr:DUF6194 family protein [Ktedonobacteraceae bacterium]
MNEAEISRYITESLEGVDVVADSGNSFFFYNPDSNVPPDHRFPFVTLVTNDLYDQFSNLNRPSVFRLNIGIGKQTFRSLFGDPVRSSGREGTQISGENVSDYDFTALDQVMPHPVYGRMYWVCVLNPGEQTFETKVRQLLDEAYDLAVSKYRRQAARRSAPTREDED